MTPEERAEKVMMSNRYAGSIHEAIAELAAAIREAENAAYERAAETAGGVSTFEWGGGDEWASGYAEAACQAATAIRSLKTKSA